MYNKIMARYVRKRIEGVTGLPQILGLTASPGTGGARSLEGAIDHVLEVQQGVGKPEMFVSECFGWKNTDGEDGHCMCRRQFYQTLRIIKNSNTVSVSLSNRSVQTWIPLSCRLKIIRRSLKMLSPDP